MLYIKDLIKRCKEKGYEITRMGLYLAGKRVGFITEDGKGNKELDIEKFNKWIDTIVKSAPDGYISAKQIMNKYKVTQTEAYFILNDPDCVVVRVGGYGVMYGEEESVKSVITKRSKKHTYNWEEGKENGNN